MGAGGWAAIFQNFWYMHCDMANGKVKLALPGLVTPATAVACKGTVNVPKMPAKKVRTGPSFCPWALCTVTCTAGASLAVGVMGKACTPVAGVTRFQ